MDEHGYVFATIPATTTKAGVPVIGFIAHVDTSPEMRGAGVKPIVHARCHGQDIVASRRPHGRAAAQGQPRPGRASRRTTSSRPRGRRCWAPTTRRASPRSWPPPSTSWRTPRSRTGPSASASPPTRRSGQGTRYFDVKKFGALCAYTMDGGPRASWSGDLLRRRLHRRLPGLQHPSGLRQGEDGQRDQGRRRFHLAPPQGPAVARDHRRLRGVRPPLRDAGRRGANRGQAHRARLRDRQAQGEGGPRCELAATDGRRRWPGARSRSRSRSSTGTCARCSTSTPRSWTTPRRPSRAPA